jgi:hypothetical protein
MTPEQLEQAFLDPETVFGTPESVLAAAGLTDEQKLEILRRWEYNAAEEAVALEEGMPGDDSGMLRRILQAIGTIAGPIDVEHTGPTKQHGLTREAVGSSKRDEAD